MYAGIQLDQAPLISIPFRFLLTGPWFGVLSGMLIFFMGDTMVISRWQPETLALVHVLVLGFITMVMVGALFQMLPVVAGVSVNHAQGLSWLVHLGISLGTLLLVFAFLFRITLLYGLASAFLIPALVALIIAMTLSLKRAIPTHTSAAGMKLALIALFITLCLAALLIFIRISQGYYFLYYSVFLSQLHQLWGLIGWITMLIIAIAFQVIPMFQMTPEYPGLFKKLLLPVLFSGLIMLSADWMLVALGVITSGLSERLAIFLVGLVFLSFSLQTMRLQSQRKRRIRDTGFWFWRVALLSLLLCAIILLSRGWLIDGYKRLDPNQWHFIVAILFLYGFVVTLVNGMLYKIVPFLVWLHLQQSAMSAEPMYTGRIPDMKSIISDDTIWPQFWLHISALTSLLLWVFYTDTYRIAGFLVCLSFGKLGLSLNAAFRRYRSELALIKTP